MVGLLKFLPVQESPLCNDVGGIGDRLQMHVRCILLPEAFVAPVMSRQGSVYFTACSVLLGMEDS